MRPVTATTYISASREEVFDYVADLANHVAFADHYLRDFRLARTDSYGLGAAVRFAVKPPLAATYAGLTITTFERPHLLVLDGRSGRVGRTRYGMVWEFGREAGESTRVGLTTLTDPGLRIDSFKEGFGARRWYARQMKVALERLRQIFEEGRGTPMGRATVASFEGLPTTPG